MLLQVCPNGARTPDEHPALSAEPSVIAADVAASVQVSEATTHVGVGSVHVHPKDPDGCDSLASEHVDRWIRAFRGACPHVELGVTTGAWSASDPAERCALIGEWQELPDIASVNWHEDGAEDVAGLLLSRGIGVEAGIWTLEAAERWAVSPLAGRCTRVLVEIQDIPGDQVLAEARAILGIIRSARPASSILLHGEERSAWPAFEIARGLRLDTRIGLEDTLALPDGAVAASNAQLVDLCGRRLAD
ncbi:3-keto-5-aminohexanoate cleavage protein [Brachybacterium sp. ACRRE]|uniref:3-keto-5-aminohexanoate cleavage protein n=1 Tax=Brachybacterium sp. ACRRE TaxID=2918184 RepID=UPI001EF39F34|nr:3-keto-5-aminohexanoate cleavage protein [Brachybacterium sp. ACRRE]MCG7308128.1 3-keto-5-aminohexanoate cleavage protein [Brachybacterium sp. ACRRE]